MHSRADGKEPAEKKDGTYRSRGCPVEWSLEKVSHVGSRGPGLGLEEPPKLPTLRVPQHHKHTFGQALTHSLRIICSLL